MSNLTIKTGNIFTSQCRTLVNTVGVMGDGIALEFKLRLPEMFDLLCWTLLGGMH